MFQSWKRHIYRTPDRTPLGWAFLVMAVLFLVQGLFGWRTLLLIRGGMLIVGVAYCALFAAESLAPQQRQIAGNVRLLGVGCSLLGGVLLTVGGIGRLLS